MADRCAFLPLRLCVQLSLTRSGRKAESGQTPNAGVRRRIVVGIAVVADIAGIRGRSAVNGAKPPIDTISKTQRACIVADRRLMDANVLALGFKFPDLVIDHLHKLAERGSADIARHLD